jgi:MOB kinase activator 1
VGFELIRLLAHLNTSYRHFFLFVHEVRNEKETRSQTNLNLTDIWQFGLVEKKELAPLDELNDAILAEDKGR